MKILYSNGDSFVFGMECIDHFSKHEHNKELAFPKHIAVGLNCETYINNAYNGATNEFIFRTTIFDLLKLEKHGTLPSDVFVVIGWTSLHRFEIDGNSWFTKHIPGIDPKLELPGIENATEYIDYDTVFVNPNFSIKLNLGGQQCSTHNDIVPFCVDYVWHDHIQNPQHEARLLALHGFLTAKGYKHIFLNTCGEYQFTMLDNDTKNFYKLSRESFYDWAKMIYPNEGRKNNHLSPIPHQAYGALLVDYIRENIL